MVRTLDGTGILSGTWDDEEIERSREQERQNELAAAERVADQEAAKHKLETVIVAYLKDHIAAELQDQKKPGTNTQSREDFLRFKTYCAKFDLDHLPACPQVVAGFLVSELDQGRQHLNGLIKSISETHLRCDLHDPTGDLLVKALIRLASDDEPQQEKETDNG